MLGLLAALSDNAEVYFFFFFCFQKKNKLNIIITLTIGRCVFRKRTFKLDTTSVRYPKGHNYVVFIPLQKRVYNVVPVRPSTSALVLAICVLSISGRASMSFGHISSLFFYLYLNHFCWVYMYVFVKIEY